MLFGYFLKRFFLAYLVILGTLVLLVLSCSSLFRAPTISFINFTKVILYFLPMSFVYCMPLAATISVYWIFANIISTEQGTFISMMRAALKDTQRSVYFFIAVSTVWFGLFVGILGPTSYRHMKSCLINLARQQFETLSQNEVHQITPGLSFYYKGKSPTGALSSILIISVDKSDRTTIFSAQQGVFTDTSLLLSHGGITTQLHDDFSHAYFKETTIHIDSLFDTNQQHDPLASSKYKSFFELNLYESKEDTLELLKRCVHIAWFVLGSLLAGFFALIIKRDSFIWSVMIGTLIFLASYGCIAILQALAQPVVSLGALCSLFALIFYLNRKLSSYIYLLG